MNIPVDISKIRAVVVGDPTAQIRDGAPVLDRTTGQPIWKIPATMMGDFRAFTVDLGVPEGGFPKTLGAGAFLGFNSLIVVTFDRKEGGLGVTWRDKSVKIEGGSAGVKGVAA
jgi:hypothetical protein